MTAEALLYAGRINALNGESGSGKTWVALQTVAEVLFADEHVIYIDLEDHPASIMARLRDLNVPDGLMVHGLHYIQPDQPLSERAAEYVDKLITHHHVSLVVIDSIGELMALQGCKPNDDDEVARLYRAIPRRWARLGPCVLLLDHVPKTNDRSPLFGIGSQRKRAAIDGAAYMVEQTAPFSAERSGQMRLVTAKDRSGWFATGVTAALIDVEAGERLSFTIRAPAHGPVHSDKGLPTGAMEAVTAWLYTQPERTSYLYRMRQARVVSSKATLDHALTALVEGGFVRKEERVRQGRPSTDYVWVKPFRADEDHHEDGTGPIGPTTGPDLPIGQVEPE
jgi:hypothetical protein